MDSKTKRLQQSSGVVIPEPIKQPYTSAGRGYFRVVGSTKDAITTHDFRQLVNTKK